MYLTYWIQKVKLKPQMNPSVAVKLNCRPDNIVMQKFVYELGPGPIKIGGKLKKRTRYGDVVLSTYRDRILVLNNQQCDQMYLE